MTLGKVRDILDAEVLCCAERLSESVISACGSDLMSDVLAFVKNQSVLLSGMVNPQVIRTAEMVDISCVVFVRGKVPDSNIINLAIERNICLMSTRQLMFSACGLLYTGGLRGGEVLS